MQKSTIYGHFFYSLLGLAGLVLSSGSELLAEESYPEARPSCAREAAMISGLGASPAGDASERVAGSRITRPQILSEAELGRMLAQSDWEVLGLAPGATVEEAHLAYRRLSHRYHHDAFPLKSAEEKARLDKAFNRINEAYQRIKDGKAQGGRVVARDVARSSPEFPVWVARYADEIRAKIRSEGSVVQVLEDFKNLGPASSREVAEAFRKARSNFLSSYLASLEDTALNFENAQAALRLYYFQNLQSGLSDSGPESLREHFLHQMRLGVTDGKTAADYFALHYKVPGFADRVEVWRDYQDLMTPLAARSSQSRSDLARGLIEGVARQSRLSDETGIWSQERVYLFTQALRDLDPNDETSLDLLMRLAFDHQHATNFPSDEIARYLSYWMQRSPGFRERSLASFGPRYLDHHLNQHSQGHPLLGAQHEDVSDVFPEFWNEDASFQLGWRERLSWTLRRSELERLQAQQANYLKEIEKIRAEFGDSTGFVLAYLDGYYGRTGELLPETPETLTALRLIASLHKELNMPAYIHQGYHVYHSEEGGRKVKAMIELIFQSPDRASAERILAEAGIQGSDQDLVFRRFKEAGIDFVVKPEDLPMLAAATNVESSSSSAPRRTLEVGAGETRFAQRVAAGEFDLQGHARRLIGDFGEVTNFDLEPSASTDIEGDFIHKALEGELSTYDRVVIYNPYPVEGAESLSLRSTPEAESKLFEALALVLEENGEAYIFGSSMNPSLGIRPHRAPTPDLPQAAAIPRIRPSVVNMALQYGMSVEVHRVSLTAVGQTVGGRETTGKYVVILRKLPKESD